MEWYGLESLTSDTSKWCLVVAVAELRSIDNDILTLMRALAVRRFLTMPIFGFTSTASMVAEMRDMNTDSVTPTRTLVVSSNHWCRAVNKAACLKARRQHIPMMWKMTSCHDDAMRFVHKSRHSRTVG